MRLIDCFSPLISLALHGKEGSNVQELEGLHVQLMNFVEQSRGVCTESGYTEKQCESALFAVVSWIDERNLLNSDVGHIWVHLQLQKTLFNTTSAGDEFFERVQKFTDQDTELLDVYRACLALGFRGRMFDDQELFDEFSIEHFGCKITDAATLQPTPLFAEAYNIGKKNRMGQGRLRPSTLQSCLLLLASLAFLGGMYFVFQQSLDSLYLTLISKGL